MLTISKANAACKVRPITHASHIPTRTATQVQPRAIGEVHLQVKPVNGRTEIRDLRQAGSLKCLFPRRDGPGREAVLVNTAGGITGGDSFSLTASTEPGTELTLTTQAAERAYRATGPDMGQVTNRITVAAGARLNWLPQETLLFDGSALSRNMQIDLSGDARLLFCEPLVFGRMAMHETLHDLRFRDRIRLQRNGAPIYLDALQLTGDAQAQLDRPFVANGARAMASLVYIGPDAAAHLDPLRALLPPSAGASLLADDMLVLRLLASDSFDLRQSLVPTLSRLLRSALPRCWMI
jgi:urease accessory protein